MPYNCKDTLCWTCEWAGGKDEKCPWAKDFTPVEGWKATPTKILRQSQTSKIEKEYTDSFIVHKCPLYELMTELKRRIVENAGITRARASSRNLDALFGKHYKRGRKEKRNEQQQSAGD